MGAGAALFAASAIFGGFGQMQANRDEAKALKQNAEALKLQKRAAEVAAKREANLQEDEAALYIGEQITNIARSGVVIEGSALSAIALSKANAAQENNDIKFNAAERALLFDYQINQNLRRAKDVGGRTNQIFTMFGAGLKAGGNYLSSSNASNVTASNTDLPQSSVSSGSGNSVMTSGQRYDSMQPWLRR